MDPLDERRLNQAAYHRLRDSLEQAYGRGRFIAISGGQVVADAGGFDELRSALAAAGISSSQALIVQAGVEYPETAVIFSSGKVG